MTLLTVIWAAILASSATNLMFCKIADLIADIPAAGGLASRCKDYICNDFDTVDIVISQDLFHIKMYGKNTPEDTVAYMEAGYLFNKQLINFNGFCMHSSAAVFNGKAYLFSGNSGVGKSTHTRLWQSTFGRGVRVINDDKPALRRVDGTWYAYGTPWCGKDGINLNEKAPVAGLCFLKQASENNISRLSKQEALKRILGQTIFKFDDVSSLDKLLKLLDLFLNEIPVYELENLPEPSAAILSYETMCPGSLEVNL